MDAGHLDEASSQYKGRVTSKLGDTVQTTAIVGSKKDIGSGMRVVEMTPAARVFSGYATGYSHFGDLGDAYGGGVYELLSLGGGTVTPSKYCVTLDVPIDVRTIMSASDPATGLMNTITTSTTFGVTAGATANCVGGTTPAVGDTIILGQPFWEPVTVTGVVMTSAGHWNVIAPVRFFHRAGQNIWESPGGGEGGAFTANTATGDDPAGIPYYSEIVGHPDATHVVMVKYAQGHLDNMELNNGFGNVSFSAIGLSGGSNTAGVLTLVFYASPSSADPRLYGYPVVTLRGVENAAFNGPCYNLRNYRYYGQGAYAADCDQPASTGLGFPYSDPTVMTFGTTGYGNTQLVIDRMARAEDVNTYPAYPGCYTSGGCVPSVAGQFRLGANKMLLPTDGTGVLLAAHDYAMLVDYNDH